MLNDLLRIKRIREKSAEDEVRKCRYRVELAVQDVEKKKQELVSYKEWRIQEEKRLYDEIMNTAVKQFDLDIVKQTVALHREKDLILQDAITQAEEHLEETRKELEEAQQKHVLATQAVQKFEEFTDVINQEEAKEKARIEELELEEFTPRNRY
ncbi:type III secretion system stalk subunit SctO [Parendozoicomonas haliclonae]|uniref:Type III secretion protein YscO n=1 Tax=Parendozoicomonas haliclonae TaxID=1960125 RepID=A0A1X7AJU6_9GAMM|nr:YscO family type III secretion system apparatus protein [Parendozoicomonas haliclonae]SMA42366.1 Type III secretion protein YscO [Parendozoicomonas haliclonae]